jgi:hypothetical protein
MDVKNLYSLSFLANESLNETTDRIILHAMNRKHGSLSSSQ